MLPATAGRTLDPPLWLTHAACVGFRAGLLREHDFRQLFVADAVSQLGIQVSLMALPLVAVLALQADQFEVGLLAACETAAFLFIGLPAGAWVDRWRRRGVLIAGDLVRALVLITVPLAWWGGWLTMPQLYAVALLIGVGTVFFDVAYQSYLPHLVRPDQVIEGNSRLEAVRSVNWVAGPAAGGLLVQWLTAPYALVVNCVTYLVSALFVVRIRRREPLPVPSPGASLRREIVEGLRFVIGHRLLRATASCTSLANFFGAMTTVMQVILLARVLELAPGAIGVFLSVVSAGAVLGAVAVRPIVARLGQGPTIWMAMAFSAPFGLLLPLAERGWLLWLAAAGSAVSWFGSVVYNITQLSFRQLLTPPRLLGRMNATMRFLVWGSMPVGSIVAGVLGQHLGVRPVLWIAAIGQMLVFLPTFLSPLRHMRVLPTAASDSPAKELSTA